MVAAATDRVIFLWVKKDEMGVQMKVVCRCDHFGFSVVEGVVLC